MLLIARRMVLHASARTRPVYARSIRCVSARIEPNSTNFNAGKSSPLASPSTDPPNQPARSNMSTTEHQTQGTPQSTSTVEHLLRLLNLRCLVHVHESCFLHCVF